MSVGAEHEIHILRSSSNTVPAKTQTAEQRSACSHQHAMIMLIIPSFIPIIPALWLHPIQHCVVLLRSTLDEMTMRTARGAGHSWDGAGESAGRQLEEQP